jgi:hypothetical protein
MSVIKNVLFASADLDDDYNGRGTKLVLCKLPAVGRLHKDAPCKQKRQTIMGLLTILRKVRRLYSREDGTRRHCSLSPPTSQSRSFALLSPAFAGVAWS